MNADAVSIKTSRPVWMLLLAALAVLSLAFVWRGAGRMMRMQTQAESNAEFAQLKTEEEAKIVVEVAEAPADGFAARCWRSKMRRTTHARARRRM